jgi:hypothetical protein
LEWVIGLEGLAVYVTEMFTLFLENGNRGDRSLQGCIPPFKSSLNFFTQTVPYFVYFVINRAIVHKTSYSGIVFIFHFVYNTFVGITHRM